MRRSYRAVFRPIKRKIEGAEKEVKKGGKEDFSKWAVKEVLLNPQFPRVAFLLVAGVSALTFYSANPNAMMSKGKPKSNEPVGDIKVERYRDRLSRYASSMELMTNHTGAAHLDKENVKTVNAAFQMQDQLGMNFNDLTREQLLAIQAAQQKRNLTMKLYTYEKEMMNKQTRSKVGKAILRKEASVSAEKGKEKEPAGGSRNISINAAVFMSRIVLCSMFPLL